VLAQLIEAAESSDPALGTEPSARAGLTAGEIRAIDDVDLRGLHQAGAHPILIMQFARVRGVDVMEHFAAAEPEVLAVVIEVDLNRCEGFASCVLTAPEIFDLDPAGSKVVLLQASVDEGRRSLAVEAANSCPVQAIRVR
jgi:ferredoxin